MVLVLGCEQDKEYYICLELGDINSSLICSEEGSRMFIRNLENTAQTLCGVVT
jgi:hypothetical protein